MLSISELEKLEQNKIPVHRSIYETIKNNQKILHSEYKRVIRFKEFFKLLMAQKKEKIKRPNFFSEDGVHNTMDINEILRDQDRIDRAVLFKLKHQENTYVHFVEIDIQERWKLHKDRFPLLKLRLKIWGWYT
jgi:hypothetical protein